MKDKTLLKLLAVVALASGILAFAMMFFGAIKTSGDDPIILKGNEIAFGRNALSLNILAFKGTVDVLFSFGVLLAYLVPLCCGLLIGLVELLSKKKGSKFLFGLISFAGFVFAIILLLTIRNMARGVATSSIGSINLGSYDFTFKDWSLDTPLILAIVFSALGLCTSGSYTIFQLLKNPKKRK